MAAGEGAEHPGHFVAEQIGQRGLGLRVFAVTRQTPREDPRARRVMTENGLYVFTSRAGPQRNATTPADSRASRRERARRASRPTPAPGTTRQPAPRHERAKGMRPGHRTRQKQRRARARRRPCGQHRAECVVIRTPCAARANAPAPREKEAHRVRHLGRHHLRQHPRPDHRHESLSCCHDAPPWKVEPAPTPAPCGPTRRRQSASAPGGRRPHIQARARARSRRRARGRNARTDERTQRHVDPVGAPPAGFASVTRMAGAKRRTPQGEARRG